MADFKQEIVLTAVDNVSKTLTGITTKLGLLGQSASAVNLQMAEVGRTGTVFANKIKNLGLVVAAATTGLFWLSYRTSDAAESLLNLSQKTGVSVDELQKLNYVADQSNIGAENLAMGFTFLNRAISTAASDAGSDAASAFTALGVTLTNADGSARKTEDVFYDLADAFDTAADGPNKVNAAVKLFGRSGASLIPILNRGSESLRKQGEQFTKYGNLIDKNGLTAIADFNDEVDNLLLTFKALGSVMAQSFIPVFSPLVKGFADWVASNKELIRLKITDWITSARDAFVSFLPKLTEAWNMFKKGWEIIGGFQGILKGLAIFIASDVLIAFTNFALAIAALGKALLFTPIGAFAASIAAIVFAVYKLNEAFPELGNTVKGVVDSMFKMFGDFFDWFGRKIQSLLEALHIIDNESSKVNNGTLTSVVDPKTGKSKTTFNNTGLPTQTDFASLPDTSTGSASPKQGPLDGIWEMISNLNENKNKPMEINVKLNTENEVSYVDIDAPLTANVSVNAGPMLSY